MFFRKQHTVSVVCWPNNKCFFVKKHGFGHFCSFCLAQQVIVRFFVRNMFTKKDMCSSSKNTVSDIVWPNKKCSSTKTWILTLASVVFDICCFRNMCAKTNMCSSTKTQNQTVFGQNKFIFRQQQYGFAHVFSFVFPKKLFIRNVFVNLVFFINKNN